MIWTVFQLNVRRLLHSPIELMLAFVVPIVFFSIFAVIFGKGIGGSKTTRVKAVVVDEVGSATSQAMIALFRDSAGLRLMRDPDSEPIRRDEAARMVRSGGVTTAIVLRDENQSIKSELLADASDQVAGQLVSAIVTQALIQASLDQNPFARAQLVGDSIDVNLPQASDASVAPTTQTGVTASNSVSVVDVIGKGKANPVVSMYAAGIAVMFLLFGATGGGGALLEERESQTLDRLLSTQLTMDQLLLGKWFYLTVLGVVQVCVMFIWGQAIFSVDLLGHLDGFAMMTIVTAAAAAAFGLFLATLCKTRGQLNGLSVILVLTMSALGGSMVPRYVMSEQMRDAGMWTFNAWALDGYDKVFWRDLPAAALAPQLIVLMLSGIAFLLVARVMAIRWETN